MNLQEQLIYIRENFPEAYKYMLELQEIAEKRGYNQALSVELPRFDDDDNIIR